MHQPQRYVKIFTGVNFLSCPRLVVAGNILLRKSRTLLTIAHHGSLQALNWAVQNKVDIISMSWSFLEKNADKKFKAALDRASQKCLVFASSPETDELEGTLQNAGSQKYLPAGHERVFAIGVSDPNVDPLHLANDETVFRFPGSNVELFEGTQFAKIVNGSSISTAVAAGFVGLILYSMKLVIQAGHANSKIFDNSDSWDMPVDMATFRKKYEKARTFEGMKTLLNTFCTSGIVSTWQAKQRIPNLEYYFMHDESRYPSSDPVMRLKELRKMCQRLCEMIRV